MAPSLISLSGNVREFGCVFLLLLFVVFSCLSLTSTLSLSPCVSPDLPSFASFYLHLNSTRAGLGFIFVAFACLAGSPVAGAILRSNGQGDNYLGVCLFGGCSTLVGTGLLTLARARMVKRKGTWKV
jgi:hypothetical protein